MTDLYNDEGVNVENALFILNDEGKIDPEGTEITGKWLLASDLHVTGGGKG